MSEVQIAIIDQENTQIALAVPGVQGPAGAISSGGSANQVFHKVSGTNYDAGWTFIGNANVDAAAAIAGTKISPNFGSQTVATTGVFSHALGSQGAPTITFTGDTNTGIYSPGADQVAISTNGTARLFVDASGNVHAPVTFRVGNGGAVGALSVQATTNGNLHIRDITTITTGTGVALDVLNDAGSAVQDFAIRGTNTIFNNSTGETLRITSTGALNFKGAGTAGSTQAVSFNGSAPVNSMVLTSGGLLGIGTSSPSEKLHLGGSSTQTMRVDGPGVAAFIATAAADVAQVSCNRSPLTGTRVDTTRGSSFINLNGTTSGGSIEFNTSSGVGDSSFRAIIDSSGRLGIGTTSPGAKLQVETSADDDGITINSELVSRPKQLYFRYSNTGSGGAVKSDGPLTFWSGSGTPFERCRLDGSGRLLVGTSSTSATSTAVFASRSDGAAAPLLALHTTESTVTNGANFATLSFGNAATTGTNAAAFIQGQRDGGTWTNNSSMPGRLVFSTTADGASSPTERMRITNAGGSRFFCSTGDTIDVASAEAAGTTRYLFLGAHSATGTGTGTNCYRVYTSGNVQNTNNSYAGISDIKLKENIVDATPQWDDIKALKIRKYNFKEGQTHTQIGLVAQEVELVSPGLVTESPDRDAEGNDLGTTTKAVQYSVLYMKAVKALQEAMERIEQLEAKVAALEGA